MAGLHPMHVLLAVCAVLVLGLMVWLAYTIIQQQLLDARARASPALGEVQSKEKHHES